MENLLSKLAALRSIRINSLVLLAAVITIILVSVAAYLFSNKLLVDSQNISDSSIKAKDAAIERIKKELDDLKNQDQLKINLALAEEIKNINKTYQQASTLYERLVDLRKSIKTDKLDPLYVKAVKLLADKSYASAAATLTDLEKQIKVEEDKKAASFKIPENVPISNTPPSSGFSSQRVEVNGTSYLVNIISADLNSTKVIVDTASEGDCRDNCPTLSLAEYVSRNGAFAGINGSFFCPAEYPSCAGKTNSFDTLLMNKNKRYFNSDNNVYSTVPAAIFRQGSARFVNQTLEWGRDTGVDAVIANHPLYVTGGRNNFGGSSDPKITSRGARTFIANKGNMVYIGIVYNSGASEAAAVLTIMGMENALGLDQGGSTALWSGGYKAGPGRNIPNAVLFVGR